MAKGFIELSASSGMIVKSTPAHFPIFSLFIIITFVLTPPAGCENKAERESAVRALNHSAAEAYSKGDLSQAETNYSKALEVARQMEPNGVTVFVLLTNLGAVLCSQRKFDEAERAFVESLRGKRKILGATAPSTAETARHYALLLRKMHRDDDAQKIEQSCLSAVKSPSNSTFGGLAGSTPTTAEEPTTDSEPVANPNTVQGQPRKNAKTHIIKEIYVVGANDRQLMNNPTMATREVIDHYETRYRTLYDSYNKPYQESYEVPIYRTERYQVSEAKDLQFMKELADLKTRYRMTSAEIDAAADTMKSGGALIELENGWIIDIAERLERSDWSTGARVITAEHPRLNLPFIVLYNDDRKKVVPGKIIDLH